MACLPLARRAQNTTHNLYVKVSVSPSLFRTGGESDPVLGAGEGAPSARGPPKELRHNRCRPGHPGSQFTSEEKTNFRQRTLAFFRKRMRDAADGAPSAETQQKAKKRNKTIPKLATSDWLHALHTTLDVGLPHGGLKAFHVPPMRFDEDESPSYKVEQTPLLTIGPTRSPSSAPACTTSSTKASRSLPCSRSTTGATTTSPWRSRPAASRAFFGGAWSRPMSPTARSALASS